MVSYTDLIEWCQKKEPTAFKDFLKSELLCNVFNEIYETDKILQKYMRPLTFRRYLYSDTLHTFIMQSDEAETNDLQTLHKKYGIDSGENMLLTSASDSGTAGSKLVPSVLQQGDIATMEYYQTPYGKFVEMMNEQLTHIVL